MVLTRSISIQPAAGTPPLVGRRCFKPWFSLYDSQSSNDFLLMERPSIVETARNVAAGDARATIPGLKASTDRYFAAWALTGPQFGAQTSNFLNGEQLSTVGRLAGRPYYDEDWNFHLDFSGEYVFHTNDNAANASSALFSNTSGNTNTAIGAGALYTNEIGSNNTAAGVNALYRNTGDNNIALGVSAGYNLHTGNNNIYIGNAGNRADNNKIRIGTVDSHKHTFIAGISGFQNKGHADMVRMFAWLMENVEDEPPAERSSEN